MDILHEPGCYKSAFFSVHQLSRLKLVHLQKFHKPDSMTLVSGEIIFGMFSQQTSGTPIIFESVNEISSSPSLHSGMKIFGVYSVCEVINSIHINWLSTQLFSVLGDNIEITSN